MQPPPPVAVLRGHQKPVTSLCFIPDRLVSCSQGCELFIWDLKTRRVIRELNKFEENEDGLLRVCANDSLIVSNSRLGRLLMFDLEGNEVTRVDTNISAGFAGCRIQGTDIWFPDAFNGRLYIYDTKSGSYFPGTDFKNHGMIMDMNVRGDHIGLALEDSTVCVFDVRYPAEPVWTNELKLGDPAISIAVVADDRCVIGSAQSDVIEVTPTGKSVFYTMPDKGVDDIEIRCDERIWATAGWDGRVRLFDAKKRKPLAVLKHHVRGVHTVTFAQDGLLASGGEDRGIALWSLYRKK